MARDNDENGANEKYMYSDKINVNILTSLMVAHGVRTVVVCPGSRNAPLAHNFASCPEMHCVAATDERRSATMQQHLYHSLVHQSVAMPSLHLVVRFRQLHRSLHHHAQRTSLR